MRPPLFLALTAVLALPTGTACAVAQDAQAPPRFELSNPRLEQQHPALVDSRFRLQADVQRHASNGKFEMPGFRLQTQWQSKGAGCVPDLIFANGFQ